MKLLIASDHAGYDLKQEIKNHFSEIEWIDVGADNKESCNYAAFAHKLAEAIVAGKADKGVLICGAGIGVSMAANRHNGVRSALCTNETMARFARLHNDANVIALGARIIGSEVAKACVKTFIGTNYEGGRHQKRVETIDL